MARTGTREASSVGGIVSWGVVALAAATIVVVVFLILGQMLGTG